jgi:hypothetical protein
MPNQDMLFPILPRPTPPVNLHDIVHHDVPRVEKQTETHGIDTEQHHPQQQPNEHHANDQSQDGDTTETDDNAMTSDGDKHPEHIDIFI